MAKLGDIFKTTSGSTPLSSNKSFYDNGTISWLTSGEVSQGKISYTKKFITQKALEKTSVKLLPKHSVVVAMYGATVGEVGILNIESTTNQAVCGILPNLGKANPFYIYYHLLNRKSELIKFASGSARTNISQKIIQDFEINLPSLQTQTVIANILSSLDDKIELNNTINKELENLAKNIYDYWFVQFDFPGENKRPYKSSGGKMKFYHELGREIPADWKIGKISDYVEKYKGGDWGKEAIIGNYTEKVHCIRGTDFPSLTGVGNINAPIRYILPKNTAKKLDIGDLIIEISGGSPTQSTGRICYINQRILSRFDSDIITSNFCKAITLQDSNALYFLYLYWVKLYENGHFFNFEGKTTGIKNFLFDIFVSTHFIPKVPYDLLKSFDLQVAPLFNKIQQNLQESEYLAKTRDFLLPMLMSGQISV